MHTMRYQTERNIQEENLTHALSFRHVRMQAIYIVLCIHFYLLISSLHYIRIQVQQKGVQKALPHQVR